MVLEQKIKDLIGVDRQERNGILFDLFFRQPQLPALADELLDRHLRRVPTRVGRLAEANRIGATLFGSALGGPCQDPWGAVSRGVGYAACVFGFNKTITTVGPCGSGCWVARLPGGRELG